MPRGAANIHDVIGANALLHRRRTCKRMRATAQKHILELRHPRHGEQRRRIIFRHQTATGITNTALLGKERQKRFTNLSNSERLRHE